MTHSFNLITEAWIPCRPRGRPEVRLLGIGELLRDAHELEELACPSPTETVAITRLLLAILHRAVDGPRGPQDWAGLWDAREQGLPTAKIDAYLDKWAERFDLFHPEHPFYQTAAVGQEYGVSPSRLTGFGNAGHFEHDADEIELDPPQAARRVVACQSFDYGGLKSHEKGRLPDKFAKAAPLIQTAIAIVRGETLAETLLLNLHQYNVDEEEPFPFDPEADRPAWERDEPTQPVERLPDGYLDLLTWQARRLRLFPESGVDGSVLIQRAIVMKGHNWPDSSDHDRKETQVAYRSAPKTSSLGMLPVRFTWDKALWRDSSSILEAASAGGTKRPKILGWLAGLVLSGVLPEERRLSVDFLGLAADKGQLLFLRHERMTLPLRYLRDDVLRAVLYAEVAFAEEVGKLVGTGRPIDLPGQEKPVGNPYRALATELVGGDTATQTTFIDHLGAGQRYWPRLDAPFRLLMTGLAEGDQEQVRRRWREAVERAARDAFAETMNAFDQSGRSLKGWARAQNRFEYALRRLVGEREPATTGAIA